MSGARSVFRALRETLEMIKFEHSVFALPFAFLGMMLAADGWPPWSTVGWVSVAMVAARSAAMAFNRLADRRIDAANPRTVDRALPSGRLSPTAVGIFVTGCSALLVVAAWRLNPLALQLSPIAIAVVLLYSYSKRFTFLSHLILGLGISAAPLGAWIAVRGAIEIAPLILASAVLLWVAGFDILYALQDQDFDRGYGLHSIPSRFGTRAALWVSSLFHVGMLLLLALLPISMPRPIGAGYWVGVAGCATLLLFQHSILRPADLSRLNAAFFRANGMLALWLFLTTAIGILLR